MDRITIEIEAVTATFLHVEPQGDARWRAAPFRGLARWWFRALVGASCDVNEVRQREEKLFGTAERPSLVTLRVFSSSAAAKSVDAPINPGSKRSADRKALPPGSRATLEIGPAGGNDDSREAVRQAYVALWTSLHLGGVGQRSRRGAGSLRVTAVKGIDEPGRVMASDLAGYAAALERGLLQARQMLGAASLRRIGDEGEFPILHPSCAEVRVVRAPWGGGESRIREGLMNMRRGFHRTPEGRGEWEFGGIEPRLRLASPVWARVANFDASSSVLVLTLMKHAGGAALGARWGKAQDFVRSLPGADVNLSGERL